MTDILDNEQKTTYFGECNDINCPVVFTIKAHGCININCVDTLALLAIQL